MKTINLTIFDDITSATAAQVRNALEHNPTAPATVRINSPGGSVLDAMKIGNDLKNHRGKVKIVVEIFVGSAATLLCCSGYCTAAENALFMIHGASLCRGGNAAQLRDDAAALDKINETMARLYAAKTHRPLTEIRQLLIDGKDHWLTAQEALAFGLIDEITAPLAIAARLGNLQPPERLKIMTEATTAESPAEIQARAIAAERKRVNDIATRFAGITKFHSNLAPALAEMQARLIGSGATPKEASNELLNYLGTQCEPLGAGQGFMGAGYAAETPVQLPPGPLTRQFHASQRRHSISNPTPYGGHSVSEFISAAADALALRMGADLPEVHPASRDFLQTSLTGIAGMALQASGINPVGMSADRLFQAAHTTSDFPVLLQESGNRTLVSRFEQLVQDHRDFCVLGDVPDFKIHKAANISQFPSLERKYEGGEIHYGSMTESAEPIQAGTYAKGFSITREATVNDDLGAFSDAIHASANAGARLERDLVFGVLTANAAMSDGKALFHADHGNLDTSAAAINIAGLGKARVLMKKQRDSSGGYVLTMPRFIVCPVALETDTESLVSSLTYRLDAAGDQQTPQWVKALRIIADPRLDAVDADDWYLLSEPGTAPVIRLAFLNGQRVPVMEQDTDFDRDVIKYKVRLDVAAAAIGFAGAVKMS